jgi:hypothetical protein
LCRGTDLGKGTKNVWRIEGPQENSVFFPELSNRVRRALVREVTKNPIVTLTELRSSSVEMREPLTIEDYYYLIDYYYLRDY